MRLLHPVMLFLCLSAFLAGCNGGSDSGSGSLAAKLVAGDFEGVRTTAARDDTAEAKFAMAVAHYFLDDSESLNDARDAALSEAGRRAAVVAWIHEHAGDGTASPVAAFLRGVAAEIEKDRAAAAEWYGKAAAADPSRPQYGWSAAVASQAEYKAEIPEERKLTYEGTLRLESSAWLPAEEDFKVTGGVVVTSMGDITMEATFGDWLLLESATPGVSVGWSPLLVSGELLLPPRAEFGPAGEDIDVTADVSYASTPFDFFGKFRVVRLGGGDDRYPMVHVPYVLRGRQWAARGFLGEQVRLGPSDADAFIQVAFFPIEIPLNIDPRVSYPERGLDFTYELRELPGEYRFKEKAQMYRLPGEAPDNEITVTNENDRLIWLANTELGRKKVWEGWIYGPLRTLPILRSADLPVGDGRTPPSMQR